MRKEILLRLRSNVSNYQITISDGCDSIQKQIAARQARLRLCACATCLRVVVRPLTGGYTGALYFWIDATCQTTFDLVFNFAASTPPTPTTALQRFTLTDGTYGLPIDGTLFFTQT